MSIALNDKERSLLKREIEEYFKIKLETKKDYDRLHAYIDHELVKQAEALPKNEKGNPIIPKEKAPSSETLMRIWGYVSSEVNIRRKTYALLARSMGYISLEECLEKLKNYQMSLGRRSAPEKNIDLDSIIPYEIEPGKEITIGWYPVKYCRLKKGEHPYEFKVLENVGFKRKLEDSFYAPGFCLNEVEGQEYPDILIDSETGWFDEPEQADLKDTEDYFLL